MHRSTSSGLPKLPSLGDLGLSSTLDQNKVSDGKKKVPYNPTRSRSVRVSQSQPERLRPATSAPRNVSTGKVYPTFSITPHSEAIARLIETQPVSAIDAPTGTGKTRLIPYIMASRGHKVRVAIPTTVAVRNSYNFQRHHSNLRIGYAAGREVHYALDDQLVYGTTGHFTHRILALIKSGKRNQIRAVLGDIFFIDEVHTATSHISLLIGLVRHIFTGEDGAYVGPRIVFSTATFNHGDIMDHFPDFPIYKVDIPVWPITDTFLTTKRNLLHDDPNAEIIRIVKDELAHWMSLLANNSPERPRQYHGMIFRPGATEVEETIEALEREFSSSDPIVFYPAYSSLNALEIDEIFSPSDSMKVIVGTNIIESSITVDDVGFVIDDMLEKIAETSSTGGNKLTLDIISKAASQQRRGRAGRTLEGRNYKLITAEEYEQLSPFRIREIDRVPIFDIVLQLIDAGLDTRAILKISQERYLQALNLLTEFNMIESVDGRYIITNIGKFVSSISLGIQNAYMVYLGYKRFMEKVSANSESASVEQIVLRTVIAVASMIEAYGPSYFYIPRRNRNETLAEYTVRRDNHIEDYHEKFRGKTDIHTFVNIFWQMQTDINVVKSYDQSTKHNFTNYIREWSVNNSMNNKKIKEYLGVMRDIASIVEAKISNNIDTRSVIPESGMAEPLPRGLLGQHGFSLGRDLPDGGFEGLGNVIANIFAQAYHLNTLVRTVDIRGRVSYVDQRTRIGYKINRQSSFNEIIINSNDGPAQIIVAQTIEVSGKKRVHLAGIFVPHDSM